MKTEKVGRNELCPCGSGKKYKKCCLIAALRDPNFDLISSEWRAVRQTEGELIELHLLPFCEKNYPHESLREAWDEFCFGEHWSEEYWFEAIEREVFEYLFIPWFLFDWIPEIYDEDSKTFTLRDPIALQYLELFPNQLNQLQKEFINIASKTYFSFYVVLEVVPKQSMKLKDIFLGKEHVLKEYQATQSLSRGDIIFTRIITINNISVTLGMMPRIIPSSFHIQLLDKRRELEKEYGAPLTTDMLYDAEEDVRWICFNILDEAFNPPMPRLHNTDGDPFEFCTVIFRLHVSPQEAFNELLPLTLSNDPEEFLSDAKKGKDGQLKQIKFPWLKQGNKTHKDWSNTLMGDITINGDKLTVEVNSRKRAENIKDLLSQYLGEGITYIKTNIKSVEKEFAKYQPPKKKEGEIDINDTPEAQAFLKEYMSKYWDNWVNEPVPALDGLTPKEAAKIEAGRERLEALLLDFERRNQIGSDDSSNVDVQKLREKLGLYEEEII